MRSFSGITGLILFLLLSVFSGHAQNEKKVLDYETFLSIVRENHPLFKQAELQISIGEANLLQARGAFDPKLFSDINQKYFDGAQYFSLLDAGLKVPTWFGVELKSGFEQNSGVYLDPQFSTPNAGLVYAGISLPVGKGLFIDERRTELLKAKLYKESTLAKRQELINELIFEAGKAYWSWFEKSNSLRVFEDAYQMSLIRYMAVVTSAELGDRSSIDTVEASMQLQQRLFNLKQAKAELEMSRNTISTYLWNGGLIPMELEENTIPISYSVLPKNGDNLPITIPDTLVEKHPALLQTKLQIDTYQTDLRWKKEQLKPELDISYNALNEPIGNNPFAAYSIRNYKWGIDLAFPVLLRKERGAVKLANLKVADYEYELVAKRAFIEAKANNALLDWRLQAELLTTVERMFSDSKALLDGEQSMFDNGESSLFMINTREMTAITSELKVIEVISKHQKSKLQFKHSLGLLAQ